jgi:hypothetical protein
MDFGAHCEKPPPLLEKRRNKRAELQSFWHKVLLLAVNHIRELKAGTASTWRAVDAKRQTIGFSGMVAMRALPVLFLLSILPELLGPPLPARPSSRPLPV